MKLISSDTTKCVKCYACTEVCPMRVIGISAEGYPEAKRTAFKLCINCGYCVDICMFDALKHKVRKRSADSGAARRRYEIMKKNRKKGEQDEK